MHFAKLCRLRQCVSRLFVIFMAYHFTLQWIQIQCKLIYGVNRLIKINFTSSIRLCGTEHVFSKNQESNLCISTKIFYFKEIIIQRLQISRQKTVLPSKTLVCSTSWMKYKIMIDIVAMPSKDCQKCKLFVSFNIHIAIKMQE